MSELGETAKDLLEEVVLQINDDDPVICYYSSEIVACIATDEYMDDFMRVFVFLIIRTPKSEHYLCLAFQS